VGMSKTWITFVAAIVIATMGVSASAGAGSSRPDDSWTVQLALHRQKFLQLSSISCPVAKFCVVDGGSRIEQTSDGGARWKRDRVQDSYAVYRVSCADAFVCRGVGVFRGSYEKFMTDRSGTWVPSSGVEDEMEPTSIEALSCPTTSVCVAVGANNLIGGNSNGFPYWVSTTQDGGNGALTSWRESLIPFRAGSITVGLTSVDCPTASVCFAVAQLSDDGAVVLKTTSGSTRWATSPITNDQRVSHLDALTARFSDVSCATTMSCTVVGLSESGRLLIISTRDGGNSWRWSVEPGPPKEDAYQFNSPPAVSCASATNCVVTDGTRLLVSSERGNEWVSFPEPTSDGLLSSLDCPAVDECFVTTQLPLSTSLQREGLGSGDIVLWRR
jgi:hypothetical protein